MTTPNLPIYRTPGPVDPAYLATLKKPSYMKRYLSAFPTTLPTATAVCGSDIGEVFTQVTTLSESAEWSQVTEGMTVHFGTAPGLSDGGIYRTRKAPSGHTLYLDENGQSAAGLAAQDLKIYNVQSGMYITVDLIDRALWAALPRITYDGVGDLGTFYRDYDKVWNEETISPPPILNIGRHWSAFTPYGESTQLITIIPKVHLWPGTDGPYRLQYFLPAGATVVYGTDDTGFIALESRDGIMTAGLITVRYPVGVNLIRAVLTVTKGDGSAGTVSTTAYRYNFIYDGEPGDPNATFTPIPLARISSDTRTRDGRSMSLTLNNQDLARVKPYGLVQYWEHARFGSLGAIPDLTTAATGFLFQKAGHSEPRFTSADVQFAGPMAALARLPGNPSRIYFAQTPATWNEVKAANSNPEYAAYHLLRHQTANLLELFDYTPQNTNEASQYRTVSESIPRASIADQVKGLLKKANLEFTCDSYGAFWNRVHPSMHLYPDRGSTKIPVRDTLDPSIYQTADLTTEVYLRRRRTKATALVWNDSDNTESVLAAEIPGGPHGQALEDQELAGWLVKDQLDLNNRVGADHHMANNPYTLEVTIPYNRDLYEPAHLQFHRVQIPSNRDPEGIARDKRFILESVQKEHRASGTAALRLSYVAETAGQAGNTISIKPKINPPPPPGTTYGWEKLFDFSLNGPLIFIPDNGSPVCIIGTGWRSRQFMWLTSSTPNTPGSTLEYVQIFYSSGLQVPYTAPTEFANYVAFGYGATTRSFSPIVPDSIASKTFDGFSEPFTASGFNLRLAGNDNTNTDRFVIISKLLLKGGGPMPAFPV